MPPDLSETQIPRSIAGDEPMTAGQMVQLKTLAWWGYELDAFKPQVTRAEAFKRIAMLRAKIKLLDDPPHTL